MKLWLPRDRTIIESVKNHPTKQRRVVHYSCWLNHPFEKSARQIGSFPQVGMKNNTCLKSPKKKTNKNPGSQPPSEHNGSFWMMIFIPSQKMVKLVVPNRTKKRWNWTYPGKSSSSLWCDAKKLEGERGWCWWCWWSSNIGAHVTWETNGGPLRGKAWETCGTYPVITGKQVALHSRNWDVDA